MKYKTHNLTIYINNVVNDDYAGECNMEIPFKHEEFFSENCGFTKNVDFKRNDYEPVFTGNALSEVFLNDDQTAYYVDNPDVIIMYIGWLLEKDTPEEIEVNYSHPFWLIHDVQHALYDESGCSIYVDEYIEAERLKEALTEMQKNNMEITFELLDEINEAYYNRFRKRLELSWEDYLELEPDLEDETQDNYANA